MRVDVLLTGGARRHHGVADPLLERVEPRGHRGTHLPDRALILQVPRERLGLFHLFGDPVQLFPKRRRLVRHSLGRQLVDPALKAPARVQNGRAWIAARIGKIVLAALQLRQPPHVHLLSGRPLGRQWHRRLGLNERLVDRRLPRPSNEFGELSSQVTVLAQLEEQVAQNVIPALVRRALRDSGQVVAETRQQRVARTLYLLTVLIDALPGRIDVSRMAGDLEQAVHRRGQPRLGLDAHHQAVDVLRLSDKVALPTLLGELLRPGQERPGSGRRFGFSLALQRQERAHALDRLVRLDGSVARLGRKHLVANVLRERVDRHAQIHETSSRRADDSGGVHLPLDKPVDSRQQMLPDIRVGSPPLSPGGLPGVGAKRAEPLVALVAERLPRRRFEDRRLFAAVPRAEQQRRDEHDGRDPHHGDSRLVDAPSLQPGHLVGHVVQRQRRRAEIGVQQSLAQIPPRLLRRPQMRPLLDARETPSRLCAHRSAQRQLAQKLPERAKVPSSFRSGRHAVGQRVRQSNARFLDLRRIGQKDVRGFEIAVRPVARSGEFPESFNDAGDGRVQRVSAQSHLALNEIADRSAIPVCRVVCAARGRAGFVYGCPMLCTGGDALLRSRRLEKPVDEGLDLLFRVDARGRKGRLDHERDRTGGVRPARR